MGVTLMNACVETATDDEVAGWVADYPGNHGRLCFGWGVTRDKAAAMVLQQIAGASPRMQDTIMRSLTYRPVDADTASAVAEMLSAAWKF